MLVTTTTQDFDKLRQAREAFFACPNIEQHLNAMPEWKQALARDISSIYFHCPIHIAKELARVEKIYWTAQMPKDGLTTSEEKMISVITRNNKNQQPVIGLDYSLDISCMPYMRTMMNSSKYSSAFI